MYRKVGERICRSPLGAELGPSKNWYGCDIIWYWNCKLHSFRVQCCRKYELFKKMLQMRNMLITWICALLKYSPINGEITFPLGLKIAKNRIIWKKLRIKVVWNCISYQNVRERICLSPPRVELGAPKISMFEIL